MLQGESTIERMQIRGVQNEKWTADDTRGEMKL